MGKICAQCHIEKTTDDFYLCMTGNGHRRLHAWCKACHKAYRIEHKDRRKVLMYEWQKRNLERRREQWRLNNKKRYNYEASLKRKQNDPEKHKAHIVVSNAIARGNLIKHPCMICGKIERVQAHHDDYSRPLDIKWLCPSHHRLFHNGKIRLAA